MRPLLHWLRDYRPLQLRTMKAKLLWIAGGVRNYFVLEFPKDVTYDADVQQGTRIPAPSEPYL